MSTLLIKNGTVVNSNSQIAADVYVENDKIIKIEPKISKKAEKIIDASGSYLFPGGVDVHTHMDLPVMNTLSCDNFQTGTLAALHGGTTTIIDFANQTKGGSIYEALGLWQKKAKARTYTDYAFHISITDFNERAKVELTEMVKNFGITSFKTFMAYNALMLSKESLSEVLSEVKKLNGLVMVHAENGLAIEKLIRTNIKAGNLEPKFHVLSKPNKTEADAVKQIIKLANDLNTAIYIVHLSTKEGLGFITDARKNNQKVIAETCIHYLLLDEEKCFKPGIEGAKYIMSPPLRKHTDREALWSGIINSDIQVIATDHCPFTLEQKGECEKDFTKIPNGVPGVEHRVELFFSEGVLKRRLSLQKFVDLIATRPAKIFGLYPQKGALLVGSDADIVIFDPVVEHTISAKTHHMNVDYSIYEGWPVVGKCKTVILRGAVAVNDGDVFIKKGFGKYLKRTRPDLSA